MTNLLRIKLIPALALTFSDKRKQEVSNICDTVPFADSGTDAGAGICCPANFPWQLAKQNQSCDPLFSYCLKAARFYSLSCLQIAREFQ